MAGANPAVLRERRSHHLVALWISAVLTALLGVAVVQSGGGWPEARMGGLLAYTLLSLVAGMLFYVTWRLGSSPAIGWLSVTVLSISLSEMPFMMMGFVATPARAMPGGEVQEVLALWMVSGFCVLGARGVPFKTVGPLAIALSAGVTLALVRAIGIRLGPDTLDPMTLLGIVQRLVLIIGIAVTSIAIWRTTELDRRFRIAYLIIFISTGLFAVNDTGVDWLGPPFGAVVTVFFLIWIAQMQVEASLTLVVRSLVQRQQELTRMAVRAATARAMVDRGSAVLDAVRSSVGPLARASVALDSAGDVPRGQREVLAGAMRREIERINRTLGGSSSEPRPFPLDEVLSPLAEFHLAQGHDLTWTESGLTVVHDPDTVARALAVALSVVTATGDRAVIWADASAGLGAPVLVRVLPAAMAGKDSLTRTAYVRDELERVGPHPDIAALLSVERLLQTHGGGLSVVLPVAGEPSETSTSGPRTTGLEMSLPFLPMGRSLPIPR